MATFIPASEREDNKRLSELSKEEIVEIAKKYTRQDWHIVRDTIAELNLEVTEQAGLQALFNTKYNALMEKARGKAQEDALASLSVPE